MIKKQWGKWLSFVLLVLPLSSAIVIINYTFIRYITKSERLDSHFQTVLNSNVDEVEKIQKQIKALQIEMNNLYKELERIENNYVTKTQDNFHMQIIRKDERGITTNQRQDELAEAQSVKEIMTKIMDISDKIKSLEGRMDELEKVANQDNSVLVNS